jgi:hypothetical protein
MKLRFPASFAMFVRAGQQAAATPPFALEKDLKWRYIPG